MARTHSHADRDDVESARHAAHHRRLFPARARDAGNLASRGLVWADCEALERRHNLGRGTLVVLDLIPESGTPIYTTRRAMLESLLPCDPIFDGDTSHPVPCGAVVLTPARRVDDALAFYQRLREANRALGCDFFEGVVMKRANAPYPVQLRSTTEEFRGWCKHRFLA